MYRNFQYVSLPAVYFDLLYEYVRGVHDFVRMLERFPLIIGFSTPYDMFHDLGFHID